MKITKRTVNHPSKVFWYCKVCKERREDWKSRQKYSTYPFCSSNCKKSFHTKHAFDNKGYKTFFTKDRFKIWLHNQISIFTPQFTSIRQDHSYRKLVRDELWAIRKEMVLTEAIYFIVFMLQEHGIPYVKDRKLYNNVFGTHISALLMQEFNQTALDYLEEATNLLEE